MRMAFIVLLYIIAAVGLLQSLTIMSAASMITHQLYGGMWVIVTTIAVGALGIISSLPRDN